MRADSLAEAVAVVHLLAGVAEPDVGVVGAEAGEPGEKHNEAGGEVQEGDE